MGRLFTQALILIVALLTMSCSGQGINPDSSEDTHKPRLVNIEPGRDRTILVISPHADDATLFIGGTIAAWTDAGWNVVVVRVTDDRYDSINLSEAETLVASATEFSQAMKILGVNEVVELGLQTDVLADISEVFLREKIIRLVRTYKPYAIATIDPYSGADEDNQDHVVVAEATAEAVWTAQFDKHHPEQLTEGLDVHGVVEQWYFGRPVFQVTDVVDISAHLDRKIRASLSHETPLRNIVHQLRLQARTAGYTVAALEAAQDGDLAPVIESLIGGRAQAVGAKYALGAAEEFRVIRFGGLMDWLKANGEPIAN